MVAPSILNKEKCYIIQGSNFCKTVTTTEILGNYGINLLPLHQRKNQGAPAAFHTLVFSYLIIHESNSKNLQKRD